MVGEGQAKAGGGGGVGMIEKDCSVYLISLGFPDPKGMFGGVSGD